MKPSHSETFVSVSHTFLTNESFPPLPSPSSSAPHHPNHKAFTSKCSELIEYGDVAQNPSLSTGENSEGLPFLSNVSIF